ncbi:MAG TPA: trehalose-phosphatase [Burkholderiaceae bacterium]|nr:trehalose-phosphatase [Burkholderiaceae bacterium]
MPLLFSESGLQRLDEVVKPGLLCVFDFDGTLAPIVAQPEQACLPANIRQRLMILSDYAPVAILTGRSLADIRMRLGFEPTYLVGNHGLEGLPGWHLQSEGYEKQSRIWKSRLENALQNKAVFDPSIWIEDKRYSLSVHYRSASDHPGTISQLMELFEKLSPVPRIVAGKCVFNLLPGNGADKGSAFLQLMESSSASSAIYVGDDVTDEDVFRLRRPDLLSIRVENASDTAAEFYLPHRLDVLRLLDAVIGRLARLPVNTADSLGP